MTRELPYQLKMKNACNQIDNTSFIYFFWFCHFILIKKYILQVNQKF